MKCLINKKFFFGVLVVFISMFLFFANDIDTILYETNLFFLSNTKIENVEQNDIIITPKKEVQNFNALLIPYSENFLEYSKTYLKNFKNENKVTEIYFIFDDKNDLAEREKRILTSHSLEKNVDKKYRELFKYILQEFSNSKITLLSVDEYWTKKDLSLIAKENVEQMANDSLVILLKEFSNYDDEAVQKFQNEYLFSLINNIDYKSAKDFSLKLFLNILEEKNYEYIAYKEELKSIDKIEYILEFSKGEVDKFSGDVYIMAFGDMMFGRYVRTLMDKNGHDYVFERIHSKEKPLFANADIVFGNLEGPIKGDGYKSSTSMVFGFPEYVAPLIKNAGFTLVSLANNHAVDQGWDGRNTTIDALNENEVSWCGHPGEADSESVYYTEISGKKIAFICFQDITFKLNQEDSKNLVSEVSKKVDFLIISPHWGYEYKNTASFEKQVKMAHDWIDNGADMIIGHHPHVVQNFEVYNDKFIFYSLGNFVFDQYWSKGTQEELGLLIKIINDEVIVDLIPMKSEKSQSYIMNFDERTQWVERFIKYGEYDENMKEMIRSFELKVKK